MTRRLALAVLAFSIRAPFAEAQIPPPPDLDAWAARALKTFDVPGMAVAVVKDGKVVVARGYGVRELGKPAPVDANTLFGIASQTKAFTAALLAILVDEGKITWDDRVVRHLPDFRMHDPWATREMTVRDLLSHHSGLRPNAGDLMSFPPTSFSREEIVRRIRFLEPVTSFRSRYAYENVLYLVAGEVVHAVTGRTWDQNVKDRIFDPLGMTRSRTGIEGVRSDGNVAVPHERLDGRATPIEYMNIDNVAPAGGINSCVADMAKWAIVQLDGGRIASGEPAARRLFSERQSREMWSPQTIIPIDEQPPPLASLKPSFLAYGLGWVLRDYRGHKMVWHTGGISGMTSRVTLIPDLKLGVVVLTNSEDAGAFQAMTYRVLDGYLGAPETDWAAAFRAAEDAETRKAAEEEKERSGKRAARSTPSLPPAGYVGVYRDAWYGDATIREEKGKLVLRFRRTPLLVGDLDHWQDDTFVVRWRDRRLRADAFATFALKPDGKVDRMTMQAVSPRTDVRFDYADLSFVPVADGNR